MEWAWRESETERIREELLRIPTWAEAEQLERIVPQKDLWTPENLVRPDTEKEEMMSENNGHALKVSMATLAALLFAAATFQVVDGSMLLGVVFFGAASCFSSLAGFYLRREKDEASAGHRFSASDRQ